MIGIMNFKGYGRKWSWTDLRRYPDSFLKDFRQNSWYTSSDSNKKPPEYNIGTVSP
jgi:hypothetical protein